MRVRRAGVLWPVALSGPVLLATAISVAVATDQPKPHGVELLENIYPNIVFGSLLPLLGALILTRLPRHPIGWLYLVCGLASAATLPVYVYARLALYDYPGQLPLGLAAGWLSAWLWALGFMPLVTLGVLLFPDGRLPSPRWRPLVAVDVAAVVLAAAATALAPGPLENHPVADNPVGVPVADRVFDLMGSIGFGLFLVGVLGAGAATVMRWRRSERTEREQLNWFASAVLLLLIGVVLPLGAVGDAVVVVAIPLLPFTVAAAILRRRLYGIEIAVRRSLVYAALTGVLLAGYAGVVAGLGSLLSGHADSAVALTATAFVAIAFAPLRERLQRSADRLLYGDQGDLYAVLAGVGRRFGDPPTAEEEGDGLDEDGLDEVAQAVAVSLRLPYARIEVFDAASPDEGLATEWGTPAGDLHAVPVSFRGSVVGRLVVAPRGPRDPFRPADLRLLDDLARQIAVAAHAILLSRALQASRETMVATREEERRRMRRDLHDGLGPALAGVALGLDAVNRIAADSPAEAAALADQLKHEVHASLADVRRLVEDLRPPALDQLGLVGAVRLHGEQLSERDPGLEVSVDAADMPSLPAAVEVAAYRIVTEALTNVSRHATARHCRVAIGVDGGGALLVQVEDDGVGIDHAPRHGVGLTAMQERAVELGGTCEAVPGARGGTRVAARLPVGS